MGYKYKQNEDYFNDINTEEKAYWLGFLYADGHNTLEPHWCVSLKLKASDKAMVEKFKNTIYQNNFGRMYFHEKVNAWETSVVNKVISLQLAKVGVVPRKGAIIRFPLWLDKTLLRHFVRGYFDGNGSMSIFYDRGYLRHCADITSNHNFCIDLQNIIKSEIKICLNIKIRKQNCSVIYTCGFYKSGEFLEWMYDNSTIFLPRKYEKFLKIKSNIQNKELVISS